MGRLFQLFGGKGGGVPAIGSPPTSWPFMVSLGTGMAPWVCHLAYADVLQRVYTEACGLPEVTLPAILDLVASTSLCYVHLQWPCHSFQGCVWPLPVSELTHPVGSSQHEWQYRTFPPGAMSWG